MGQVRANKTTFPAGIIIGAVVFGGGLLLFLILILNWSRPPKTPVGVVTAALTVIPVPTITNTPVIITNTLESDLDYPEAPPIGDFRVGTFVKISGTGGAGLRLRFNPGLEAEPQFLGIDDEIFKIEDGPEESDGYTWWYLVAPFDPSRSGWAVSNYLEVVQEP
jgi:hypothetical protein